MNQSRLPVHSFRAAVGVQKPYDFVEAAGTRVAVSRRGAGTPVLCLHATAHGGRDFENLAEALVPQGFEVVCVDWPGHGASPVDASRVPASAKRYAAILLALLPLLFGKAKPIIIGNSIGGAAALIAGHDQPEAMSALVLCNPGGLAPLDLVATHVIKLLVAFFKAGARGASWFPQAFELYYRLVLSGPAAHAQRARIVAAGPEMAPILAQAWHSFGLVDANLAERAQALNLPVLFAWAKSDQIVAWSRSKRAAEKVPHARVEFFKGNHAAFLEDPQAFQSAFLRFVRNLDLT
ncbi:alpha/beta fold hydrolase [Aquidulcibacter paucihalophilus]|uniref:alpha/beta fold hydrolase n=1 Tax=Aquidulcibacter paucihalophilus TaxID=1978549 RepID=UPI000A18D369|nr:alpha/beta fold hydrolase [Aquidulcibacter paucihalophilus]